MHSKVPCPYCSKIALRVTGADIYPHRPDLHNNHFWQCKECDAYVGCHPGTKKPLGRLANAELRQAKKKAHSVFDSVWRYGEMTRTKAYLWLAGQLEINISDCHIGMFDVETCKKAIDVCRLELRK